MTPLAREKRSAMIIEWNTDGLLTHYKNSSYNYAILNRKDIWHISVSKNASQILIYSKYPLKATTIQPLIIEENLTVIVQSTK